MVAHKILETALSPNSSFPFLFDFVLGLGLWTWTRACQQLKMSPPQTPHWSRTLADLIRRSHPTLSHRPERHSFRSPLKSENCKNPFVSEGCSQTRTIQLMYKKKHRFSVYLSPHIVPSLTDSLSITTSPVSAMALFSSCCCWQASSQGESLSTTPRQALV